MKADRKHAHRLPWLSTAIRKRVLAQINRNLLESGKPSPGDTSWTRALLKEPLASILTVMAH